MDVWLHALFAFKLLGSDWLFSLPTCFIPTEKAPLCLLDKRLDATSEEDITPWGNQNLLPPPDIEPRFLSNPTP